MIEMADEIGFSEQGKLGASCRDLRGELTLTRLVGQISAAKR
jgi:hypothetical protein